MNEYDKTAWKRAEDKRKREDPRRGNMSIAIALGVLIGLAVAFALFYMTAPPYATFAIHIPGILWGIAAGSAFGMACRKRGGQLTSSAYRAFTQRAERKRAEREILREQVDKRLNGE